MPRLDVYHNLVKQALIKDGWSITHDPLYLKVGYRRMYINLGAEQLLAAEKELCKIAIEVKSFLGTSDVTDLEHALGQYIVYEKFLQKYEPQRLLYLAVGERTFQNIFSDELGQLLLEDQTVRVLVFDENQEVITQWIPD